MSTTWTGWIRFPSNGKRSPWQLFCRRETDAACWGELLFKAPRGTDKLVRQGEADPNKDKRPR